MALVVCFGQQEEEEEERMQRRGSGCVRGLCTLVHYYLATSINTFMHVYCAQVYQGHVEGQMAI